MSAASLPCLIAANLEELNFVALNAAKACLRQQTNPEDITDEDKIFQQALADYKKSFNTLHPDFKGSILDTEDELHNFSLILKNTVVVIIRDPSYKDRLILQRLNKIERLILEKQIHQASVLCNDTWKYLESSGDTEKIKTCGVLLNRIKIQSHSQLQLQAQEHCKLSNFKAAQNCYFEALKLQKENPGLIYPLDAARLYQNIGILHATLGKDYYSATDFYKKALAAYEQEGDIFSIVTIIHLQATVELDLGDPEEAIKLCGKAIDQLGKNPQEDHLELLIEILVDRGLAYNNERCHSAALCDLEEAVRISQKAGYSEKKRAINLAALAEIYTEKKLLQKAKSLIDSAFKTYSNLDDSINKAYIYSIRGLIYLELGKLKNAECDLISALNIYTNLKKPLSRADVFIYLGKLCYRKNNYPLALSYLNQALNIFQPSSLKASGDEEESIPPEVNQISIIHQQIGLIYLAQGGQASIFFDDSQKYCNGSLNQALSSLQIAEALLQNSYAPNPQLWIDCAIKYIDNAIALLEEEFLSINGEGECTATTMPLFEEAAKILYYLAHKLKDSNPSQAQNYLKNCLKFFIVFQGNTFCCDIAKSYTLLGDIVQEKKDEYYGNALTFLSADKKNTHILLEVRTMLKSDSLSAESPSDYKRMEKQLAKELLVNKTFLACQLREELADHYLKTAKNPEQEAKAIGHYLPILTMNSDLINDEQELAEWDLSMHLRILEKLSNVYKKQKQYTACAELWINQANLFESKQRALAVFCLEKALESFLQIPKTESTCAQLRLRQASICTNSSLKRCSHALICLAQIPPDLFPEQTKQIRSTCEFEIDSLKYYLGESLLNQLNHVIESFYALQVRYIQEAVLSEETKRVTVNVIVTLGNILDQIYLTLLPNPDPKIHSFPLANFQFELESLLDFSSKKMPKSYEAILNAQPFYFYDSTNGKKISQSWLEKIKAMKRNPINIRITEQKAIDDESAKFGTLRPLQEKVTLHYQESSIYFWSFYHILPIEIEETLRITHAKQIYKALLPLHLAINQHLDLVPSHPDTVLYIEAFHANKPDELRAIRDSYVENIRASLPEEVKMYADTVAEFLLYRTIQNASSDAHKSLDLSVEVIPFLRIAIANIYNLATKCGLELLKTAQVQGISKSES